MTIEEYKKLQRNKQQKYRNVRADGYDSIKEKTRHSELLMLQDAGRIRDLRRQIKFELIPAQRDDTGKTIARAVSYVADFVYVITETGETIVEDVKTKATKTHSYVIKRKLMLERHKIRILET